MASKNWIKGRGTAGLESDLPAAAARVSESERLAAASRIPAATAGAVSGGYEDRLADALARAAGTGGKVSLKEAADAAGVTITFARVFASSPRLKSKMALRGFDVLSVGGSDVELSMLSAVSVAAPVAAPRVKAKSAPAEAQPATAAAPATPAVPMSDEDFFAFNETLLIKIKAAIKYCRNFWLAGPTGTGKSEYFERVCEMLERKFHKVSFNGESSVDDLLGHYTLRGGETVWIEGALPKAMKEGVPLICEEVDAAPAEANLAMQRALEVRTGKARRFHNARNGENVEATEGFCILATANSTGGGDYTGIYAGVQVQNAAFRDRFAFEKVDYPAETVEVDILVRRTGMARALAEKAVAFATVARNALKNGEIFTPVSTRTLLAFGSFISAFEAEGMSRKDATREAMMSAVVYKASSPSDEEALKGMIQRVFGVR